MRCLVRLGVCLFRAGWGSRGMQIEILIPRQMHSRKLSILPLDYDRLFQQALHVSRWLFIERGGDVLKLLGLSRPRWGKRKRSESRFSWIGKTSILENGSKMITRYKYCNGKMRINNGNGNGKGLVMSLFQSKTPYILIRSCPTVHSLYEHYHVDSMNINTNSSGNNNKIRMKSHQYTSTITWE